MTLLDLWELTKASLALMPLMVILLVCVLMYFIPYRLRTVEARVADLNAAGGTICMFVKVKGNIRCVFASFTCTDEVYKKLQKAERKNQKFAVSYEQKAFRPIHIYAFQGVLEYNP